MNPTVACVVRGGEYLGQAHRSRRYSNPGLAQIANADTHTQKQRCKYALPATSDPLTLLFLSVSSSVSRHEVLRA